MQINVIKITKSFIQSNKAVKELINEDPASRPFHHQSIQAKQSIKYTVETSTTQLNTK